MGGLRGCMPSKALLLRVMMDGVELPVLFLGLRKFLQSAAPLPTYRGRDDSLYTASKKKNVLFR